MRSVCILPVINKADGGNDRADEQKGNDDTNNDDRGTVVTCQS